MGKTITRKRLMLELTIKNSLVVAILIGFYTPMTVAPMARIPVEIQESVISFMGFLMAAAIIGAFELSYSRTNLNSKLQRYLAHLTKFTLYSSIMLMNVIAIVAMSVNGGSVIHILVMASLPVTVALFLYDYWDALRAFDGETTKPAPPAT